MNAPPQAETLSATAEDTWSDAIRLAPGQRAAVSIFGTFTATVRLQRRLDGSNWRDVWDFSAPDEVTYEADDGCEIRIGVPTGGFSDGTAEARISTR